MNNCIMHANSYMIESGFLTVVEVILHNFFTWVAEQPTYRIHDNYYYTKSILNNRFKLYLVVLLASLIQTQLVGHP